MCFVYFIHIYNSAQAEWRALNGLIQILKGLLKKIKRAQQRRVNASNLSNNHLWKRVLWSCSWNSLVVLMNKKLFPKTFFFFLLFSVPNEVMREFMSIWTVRMEKKSMMKRFEIIGNYRNNRNNGKSLWVDFLFGSAEPVERAIHPMGRGKKSLLSKCWVFYFNRIPFLIYS